MRLDSLMSGRSNYPQLPQEQLFADLRELRLAPSDPAPMSSKPEPAWPDVTGSPGYLRCTIEADFLSGECACLSPESRSPDSQSRPSPPYCSPWPWQFSSCFVRRRPEYKIRMACSWSR